MKRCTGSLDEVVPYLPKNKPTYLMGVGTPVNILEGSGQEVSISLTVYIRAETDAMDMYIPTMAS